MNSTIFLFFFRKLPMLYNFSQFFKDDELLLDEFLDKYTAHLDKNSDCCDILKGHYINILNIFSAPFEGQDILKRFENLAKYQILLEQDRKSVV